MRVTDDNRWGPLSEETVAAFEKERNLQLPLDFRDFLIAHHGGIPDPNFYWVVPGDWGDGIVDLYGLGPAGYRLDEVLDFRNEVEIPVDLLPIGDDGGGNYLCLGIAGPRYGAVYFVDHEIAPGAIGRERILANSFAEFLSGLQPPPDERVGLVF